MRDKSDRPLLLGGWNVCKAIEIAIAIEDMGAERYRALASRWHHTESLRALFAKLADEETGHGESVRALLDGAMQRNPAASDLDEECLRAIAHDHLFAEDGGALGGIEDLVAERQVLEKILRFEKATLHLYRGLRDVLGPSATVDRMIAEEKRHTVEIMRAIAGADGRGSSDGPSPPSPA